MREKHMKQLDFTFGALAECHALGGGSIRMGATC